MGFAHPRLLDRPVQYSVRQTPARRPADSDVLDAANEPRQIAGPKMAFGFRSRRKSQRRLFTQRRVSGDLSGFLFPALDHRGVTDDFDLALILSKVHSPAETLLIQASQLRLVSMMIGRAEKRAA